MPYKRPETILADLSRGFDSLRQMMLALQSDNARLQKENAKLPALQVEIARLRADLKKAEAKIGELQIAASAKALNEYHHATYTLDETAQLLGVGRNLCYKLANTNKLPVPVIRIGKRMMVSAPALDALLDWRSVVSNQPKTTV